MVARYHTDEVIYRPRKMTAAQLQEGYIGFSAGPVQSRRSSGGRCATGADFPYRIAMHVSYRNKALKTSARRVIRIHS